MPRKPLIAGNWKMNGLLAQLDEIEAMAAALGGRDESRPDALICPPATLVDAVRQRAGGRILIGGQDCHANEYGAHTGDVSARMLADLGATHVIVGHSERRTDHAESDGLVRAKAGAAIRAGLVPIVCVGETEAQRESGAALDVIGAQLGGSLPDRAPGVEIVIAYEPVWAIGSGRTPTSEEIEAVHVFIRRQVGGIAGPQMGETTRLLYGGSVKPSNAAEILALPNVDGALVGGASLKAGDFVAICEAAGRS